ncbi:uncharacterized protein V1518DRAFT_414228 [Limtongia smithiae]|uniref:uncharacterized protein n=1 Tax=Limtongia smithiae TaxID=1125753 RepID=UPI0034CFDF86
MTSHIAAVHVTSYGAASAEPALTLLDLLSNDIIICTLVQYLPLGAISRLASTCKTLQYYLFQQPGTIQELDLTFSGPERISLVLSQPIIKSGLRKLYLDSCTIDNDMLTALFLQYRLSHLSLSSCSGWDLDHLSNLIKTYYISPSRAEEMELESPALSSDEEQDEYDYDDDYYARRPTIKFLGLLGGPTFPTSAICNRAPMLVKLAKRAGIKTDLMPCEAHPLGDRAGYGAPAAAATAAAGGWYLAEPNARRCYECGRAEERLCLKCLVSRSCHGCHKFWCSGCDAKLVKTKQDCYDCGHTCEDCKSGVVKFCKFCKAKYCRVHQEGSTEEYCDWCSSRGGRTRFFF